MLTSLLFIFKCIISAKKHPTVQQCPDPISGADSGALLVPGVEPGHICSKYTFFSCTHLVDEPHITEGCITISANAVTLFWQVEYYN